MHRIYFSGYAPVHFLCFEPVYRQLKQLGNYEVILSGGFRHKHENGDITFHSEGFYDPFDVDKADIRTAEEAKDLSTDVVVCAHLSDSLFPKEYRTTVQIYHGVSFKNYCVREKALAFEHLCLPGPYHAQQYLRAGLIREHGPKVYQTGFAKTDALVNGQIDRHELLSSIGLNSDKKTILYAPTGDKNNSLETMGEDVVDLISKNGQWNLIIKPHDHPKNKINWFERLAPFENKNTRVIRDLNIIPWLRVADLLISDASSVITEFTVTGKPIVLLHVPKLFKKVIKRGGALDLETFGQKVGPVVFEPSGICKIISDQLLSSSHYATVRNATASLVFHDPGNATMNTSSVIQYAATGDVRLLNAVKQLKV